MLVDYRATVLRDSPFLGKMREAICSYDYRRPRLSENKIVDVCKKTFLEFNPKVRMGEIQKVVHEVNGVTYIGVSIGDSSTVKGARSHKHRGIMQFHIDNTMALLSLTEDDLISRVDDFVLFIPNSMANKPMYFESKYLATYFDELIGNDFDGYSLSTATTRLVDSLEPAYSNLTAYLNQPKENKLEISDYTTFLKWFSICLRLCPPEHLSSQLISLRTNKLPSLKHAIANNNFGYVFTFALRVFFKIAVSVRMLPSSKGILEYYHDHIN